MKLSSTSALAISTLASYTAAHNLKPRQAPTVTVVHPVPPITEVSVSGLPSGFPTPIQTFPTTVDTSLDPFAGCPSPTGHIWGACPPHEPFPSSLYSVIFPSTTLATSAAAAVTTSGNSLQGGSPITAPLSSVTTSYSLPSGITPTPIPTHPWQSYTGTSFPHPIPLTGASAPPHPWGPFPSTGPWTTGPWTSWWGTAGHCPPATWSGWTSGTWSANAPWTTWTGCAVSTTATSVVTMTSGGSTVVSTEFGVKVAEASASASGSSGSAVMSTSTAASSSAVAGSTTTGTATAAAASSSYTGGTVHARDSVGGSVVALVAGTIALILL